jgi:penicillin G amidase
MRRAIKLIFLILLLTVVAVPLAVYVALRSSLPELDGELGLAGLTAPVTISRDADGTATIDARSELDMVRALGFLHAQERYFEMDLMRRDAAGELSELFGAVTGKHDRERRLHGLRQVAEQVHARSSPEGRARMEAYVAGVNAGLEALGARPFPYLLVRAEPEPWTPADSWLVVFAMFFELHDEDASREARLHLMADALPEPLFRFLTPPGTSWDSALDGSRMAEPPMPTADQYDLRRLDPLLFPQEEVTLLDPVVNIEGSNNFALAGARTADGRALVANDMHLALRVPNIWYRVRYRYPDDRVADGEVDMVGVTLPGVPGTVVGSNGQVAWGYTNGYTDVVDLVLLELDPEDATRYRVGDDYQTMVTREELISVRGGPDELAEYQDTIWGPVIGADHRGRPWALAWTAHHAESLNGGLMEMEFAEDLDAGIAVMRRAGLPAQNVVLGDASGRIAWVHAGLIPRRVGFDPQRPSSWADPGVGWDGWLAPDEVPSITDPEDGQLWSANARVVGGERLASVGDGGYWNGARGMQIRDDLTPLAGAVPADLLAVQLDDRALFLSRWRELLLELLDDTAVAEQPSRAAFRDALRDSWDGHASVDSVGFRLIRGFRATLMERALTSLTVEVRAVDPGFRFAQIPQVEGSVWRLVTERPVHLLDPRYPDWRSFMLDVADDLQREYLDDYGYASLQLVTWGARNTTRIQHPLSLAVPQLSPYLDAPREALPGDSNMPRVQSPSFGASERMVVAPGAEDQGIFHMPGGQTGHPLSPYHLAGHAAWARGEATPLRPGETVWTLTLTP